MIRPATTSDSSAIAAIGVAAKMFSEEDKVFLDAMMSDYFRENRQLGHVCVVDEDGGAPVEVAYYVPVKATERVWELLMIAVSPELQGRGRGAEMMAHMEQALHAQGQRMVLVQTSGSKGYERTRAFYAQRGYEQEARVRDYYTSGEDMIMFRKVINDK